MRVIAGELGGQSLVAPRGWKVRPTSDRVREAIFSALGGIAVGDLDWVPGVEAQAWLVLLALSSQVLGWLLISVSLPRLPAVLTSIVLMLQPVSTVFLWAILLSEAPSAVQLTGVAIVIAGVAVATVRPRERAPAPV